MNCVYRCDQCSVSFNHEENLMLHKAMHSKGDLICPKCDKKFTRLASLRVRFAFDRDRKNYQKKKFLVSIFFLFQAHLMLHEEDENHICTECGDEFPVQV